MGRSRRRPAVGTHRSHNDKDLRRGGDDAIFVLLESKSKDAENVYPPAWTAEFCKSIDNESLSPIISSDAVQSVTEIGLFVVRGTLDKISNRRLKKLKKNPGSSSLRNIENAKPTHIQLRIWPALLSSFEATDSSAALNVVGIAPTGTGEKMHDHNTIFSFSVVGNP
jgi:hypothetical protein